MPESVILDVSAAIYGENDRIAKTVQDDLSARGVFCVNVLGAPGAGKTTTIRAIAERLPQKVFVLEADIESDIDTVALNAAGVESVQLNTHGACHLDAQVVQAALADWPPRTAHPCVLFIENIGNLVCPAEFFIGEHVKLLIVSVSDGSDKPYKYPLAFEKADVIVVNKADLLPYVDFDLYFFTKGVRALNDHAPIFLVNKRDGAGTDNLTQWITERIDKR